MTDTTRDWRAGLPLIRARSLSAAEVRTISQQRRRTMGTAVAWLVGSVTSLVLGTAALYAAAAVTGMAPRVPLLGAAIVITVLLAFGLGTALCFARAHDRVRRARVLRRQARDATVLVCEGLVTDLVLRPAEMRKLRRYLDEGPKVELEVLAQSGLVWSVNGRRLEAWVVATRGRTVEPPDRARLAAQYVRPIQTERGTFRLHQRLLSERECAELKGYLPRLDRRRVVFVVCAVVLNGSAASHLIDYVRQPVGLPLAAILTVTVVAWFDAQLVRLARTWWRMSKDLRERFVVIYQANSAADASVETVMEFLPYSGAAWTIGGRAAPWRRLCGSS